MGLVWVVIPLVLFGLIGYVSVNEIFFNASVHDPQVSMADTSSIHHDYNEISTVTILSGATIAENESLSSKQIVVFLGKNNTVRWLNADIVPHSLVSDKSGDSFWSTGLINPGDSSYVTFNHTGSFEYHGNPHPWITGEVIVLENRN